MVCGGILHGVKSIVIDGNLTALRYRDELLRPVAVPKVQQPNLIFQHDKIIKLRNIHYINNVIIHFLTYH